MMDAKTQQSLDLICNALRDTLWRRLRDRPLTKAARRQACQITRGELRRAAIPGYLEPHLRAGHLATIRDPRRRRRIQRAYLRSPVQ